MLSDKQVKSDFKAKASKAPDKYYATGVLKELGFMRKRCRCGTWFWTTIADKKVCGDPACSGGFRFFDGTPAKKQLDYIAVWKEFAKLFKKLGYAPIERYPVVARWRDDTDFVQASIYDFQPYVVSGEIKPPANPLVVPQFCVRFNDIDNVGITGAHYTGFVMIGQHAFTSPDKYDQPKYFRDIHTWLAEGLGLPNDEITYHEDAWAGGGNFGPSMEYFSRGLELGNQVYMMFEQTPSGNKELKLKVLDMGMGHERNAWFTKGASTSYDTTFPSTCKFMYKATGIKLNNDLMKRFLPLSSYLNVDEVESIDKTWQEVAAKIGMDVKELKDNILPLASLYSVAEHSRSLLVALSDGALPSNVGGGYNLRVILRRALSLIDKHGWDVELPKLAELHASYLKPLFPELREHLKEVAEILEFEKKKYNETKQRSSQIVSQIIKKGITEQTLVKLYDSNGISPEMIREEAKKQGTDIDVPDNFYAKVAALHDKAEQKTATKKEEKIDFGDLPATHGLYFDDWKKDLDFDAKVLKIRDSEIKETKFVILDNTSFYPTSGGQIHDSGTISNKRVSEVFKQGNLIVHRVEGPLDFKEGDTVKGKIDLERRKQLSQHHTATHIINIAARETLGNHVNQAGARKTESKATLDITHYENISDDHIKQIEQKANEIVKKDYKIAKSFLPRDEAEGRYGMRIYQGGAVPGKEIRIVAIDNIDVEACGGTHLNSTGETGEIKILKSSKVQDGIVRLEFSAGEAKKRAEDTQGSVLAEAASLLDCDIHQLPGRAEELFSKWKQAVKKRRKLDDYELHSTESCDDDILCRVCEILRTQPEHVTKTISRFLQQLEDAKERDP